MHKPTHHPQLLWIKFAEPEGADNQLSLLHKIHKILAHCSFKITKVRTISMLKQVTENVCLQDGGSKLYFRSWVPSVSSSGFAALLQFWFWSGAHFRCGFSSIMFLLSNKTHQRSKSISRVNNDKGIDPVHNVKPLIISYFSLLSLSATASILMQIV